MTFINTDGMSFLGPGSEWLWTAVSAMVLLATLLAIYRQVLLQRGLKEAQQFEELRREWESERLLRSRLDVALALQGGADAADLVSLSAAGRITDFWDTLGSLVRYGHVGKKHIAAQWSDIIIIYWTLLEPMVNRLRLDHGLAQEYEHIEWLAEMMRHDGHDHTRALTPLTPQRVDDWIELLQQDIALEVSLRTAPTGPQHLAAG